MNASLSNEHYLTDIQLLSGIVQVAKRRYVPQNSVSSNSCILAQQPSRCSSSYKNDQIPSNIQNKKKLKRPSLIKGICSPIPAVYTITDFSGSELVGVLADSFRGFRLHAQARDNS